MHDTRLEITPDVAVTTPQHLTALLNAGVSVYIVPDDSDFPTGILYLKQSSVDQALKQAVEMVRQVTVPLVMIVAFYWSV